MSTHIHDCLTSLVNMAEEFDEEEAPEVIKKGQQGEQARAMQNLDDGEKGEISAASAQKV